VFVAAAEAAEIHRVEDELPQKRRHVESDAPGSEAGHRARVQVERAESAPGSASDPTAGAAAFLHAVGALSFVLERTPADTSGRAGDGWRILGGHTSSARSR